MPFSIDCHPHYPFFVIRGSARWTSPLSIILLRHIHYVMPTPNAYLPEEKIMKNSTARNYTKSTFKTAMNGRKFNNHKTKKTCSVIKFVKIKSLVLRCTTINDDDFFFFFVGGG